MCIEPLPMRIQIWEVAEVGDPRGELSIIGRATRIPPGIKIEGGVSVFPNLNEESFRESVYKKGDIVE